MAADTNVPLLETIGVTVGDHVAGYRLDAVLGRGGMGVVYLAQQAYPKRAVAIKLIAQELSGDPFFRERFMHETDAMAELDHPNIIPIYEAGVADDLLYLVMRYVDGPDLRSVLLRDGRLGPNHAVHVADQVGRALDAARSHGLIHRDVKPGNILLAGEHDSALGHVYLCDFGLAKHVGTTSGLTGTGRMIGTIDYMAPEQIRGDPVDGRVDIYSLGCVVHHLLTGQTPYRGSPPSVMWAHMNEPVPRVSRAAQGVPAAADAVLERAMAKEPSLRYATCAELVADLRVALAGAPAGPPLASDSGGASVPVAGVPDVVRPARPVPDARPRSRVPRWAWLAVAVGLVLAAAAVVLNARSGGTSAKRADVSVFELGQRPSMLAAGPSGVWMAQGSRSGPRGTLTELAASRDGWRGPYQLTSRPVGLAVGSNAIWVLEAQASRTLLEQFDPTGREIRTIPIAGTTSCAERQFFFTCAPALTEDTIWVPLNHSIVPVSRNGEVGRPVQVKGGVVADIAATGDRGGLIAIAGQTIQTISSGANGPAARLLYRFARTIRPQHLIARGQLLWVATTTPAGVSALQLVTSEGILRTEQVNGLQRLAASGSALWVGQVASSECSAVGSISRLDLQTGATAAPPIPVGHQPGALAVAGGSVWVLTFDPCSHERRLVHVTPA